MDIAGAVIAFVALMVSGVSCYFQFFKKRRILYLSIGDLPNRKKKGFSVIITNGGDYSAVISDIGVTYKIDENHKFSLQTEFQFETDKLFIGSGEHMVIYVFLVEDFPEDPIFKNNIVEKVGVENLDFQYQVDLEFIDSEGKRRKAEIPVGNYSFDQNLKYKGMSISKPTIELYKNTT